MTRVVCVLLAVSMSTATAAAQRTTTTDDSIAILPGSPPADVSLGTGTSFDGQLGAAAGRTVSIAWDSSVLGEMSLQMRSAACGAADQDVIVFYFDTIPSSGFADTTAFTDVFSTEAAAVSATPRGATLSFATGFEAEFALALQNNSAGVGATLYRLVAGAGHEAIGSVTATQPDGNCQNVLVRGIRLSDLGMSQGDPMGWFATLLNGNNGFRSNEFHGVVGPDDNIGSNPFTLGADDFNVFRTIGPLVINEVDSLLPGSPDSREFIELYGPPGARLDGGALVVFNGSDDQSYNLSPNSSGIDLDGETLDGNGFWVAGNSAVGGNATFNDGALQQGADAVAVFLGDGADFPNDTPVTATGLVDALVYGPGTDTGLLSVLTPGQPQHAENDGLLPEDEASNQRCADGAGGPLVTTEYQQSLPSPGDLNVCEICGDGAVQTGEQCDDGAVNGTATSCCRMDCQFRTAGVSCSGGVAGACDRADSCNDVGICVDNVEASTTVCRAAGAGACDVAENCDGVNPDCPADGVADSSTVCRAAVPGGCDVEETCDGTTAACPADTVVSGSTECRPAAAGGCDVAEVCDGTSNTCPSDAVADASTECRPAAAGGCDIAEMCDGATVTCPSDVIADSSTVCRAAVAGGCDVAETCDGSTVVCPGDAVAAASTECRPAVAGGCDIAEVCDGSTNACPSDAVMDSSTVCRAAAAGGCDIAEICDGTTATCPSDAFEADGTACADSLVCNGDELCQSGSCETGTAPACDDADLCTADACAEPGGCENVAIVGCCNLDADCDDSDICTVNICSGPGGSCSASPITGCCTEDADCDDANECTLNSCNTGTNRCEIAPVAGCCESDGDCDDGDGCTDDSCDTTSGECANAMTDGCCLSDGDCSDANTCTTDVCAGMMCSNDALAGCCTMDADCDDGDVCTTDTCDTSAAACSNAAIDGCTAPDGGPTSDAGMTGDGGSTSDGGGIGADAGTGEVEGGCGCRTVGGPGGGRSGGSAVWLMALVGLVWRRRGARR